MTFLAALLIAVLPPYEAKVVSVHDGDTITVRTTETIKIRLSGVDAPELKQAHGQTSKQALANLVFGKTVTVTPVNKDRYGRTVAKIKADDREVGFQLVSTGNAWWYEQYDKHNTVYQQAQADAQVAKLGLWANPNPMPPWDFRKKGKADAPVPKAAVPANP